MACHRVAVVTGAGTGIGAAVAGRLHREGWGVVLGGRRPGPLQEVADRLGDGALAVPGDAAEPAGAEALVAAAVEGFGGLNAVIANAAVSRSGSVTEQTPEGWDAVLRTNLTGPFLLCRAALPHLVRRRGAVVAVSSLAGLRVAQASAAYAVSKAGLNMLVQSIAADFGRQGVRANAVCPGWVRTAMGDALMDDLAARSGTDRDGAYREASRYVPRGAPATVDEVAATVVWLAGPAAAALNGAVIPVDGGATVVDPAQIPLGTWD